MIYLPEKPVREIDPHGSGVWLARRGDRLHRGLDFVFSPGEVFTSTCSGKITKLGYPYRDDSSYRYIEVDHGLIVVRAYYVEPIEDLRLGDRIDFAQPIGIVQDLTRRYPGITNHVHIEVRLKDAAVLEGKGYPSEAELWIHPRLVATSQLSPLGADIAAGRFDPSRVE